MAESLAASELWLPQPHDSLPEKETSLIFPTEFPYEFDSPVESVVSSTESTDSFDDDDDDFFAGLTQRLAWSSLCETEKSAIPCFNPNIEKKSVKASSPQSTLKFLETQNETGSFIHAAARMKFRTETMPYNTNENDPFMNQASIPVQNNKNGDFGLLANQGYVRNLSIAAQVQQKRQDLVLKALYASYWARQARLGWSVQQKQDMQNRGRSFGHGRCQSSAWIPPPQPRLNQHPQLNGSGVKRSASSGTGVFLPRSYGNPSECRQKLGNPRIRYQVEMQSPIQTPFNGCLAPSFDEMVARRNHAPLLPLQRSMRQEAAIKHELHLPQEWTY